MGLALACICAGLTILIGVITILVVVIVTQKKREQYRARYGVLGTIGSSLSYSDDMVPQDDDGNNASSKYSHDSHPYKRYKVRTNAHQQRRINHVIS
jgi:hypothetical protein